MRGSTSPEAGETTKTVRPCFGSRKLADAGAVRPGRRRAAARPWLNSDLAVARLRPHRHGGAEERLVEGDAVVAQRVVDADRPAPSPGAALVEDEVARVVASARRSCSRSRRTTVAFDRQAGSVPDVDLVADRHGERFVPEAARRRDHGAGEDDDEAEVGDDLPNGPQRKRSAQTWTSSPSRSVAVRKRLLAEGGPQLGEGGARTRPPRRSRPVCGARSKNASVITIRGRVAALQRRGAGASSR